MSCIVCTEVMRGDPHCQSCCGTGISWQNQKETLCIVCKGNVPPNAVCRSCEPYETPIDELWEVNQRIEDDERELTMEREFYHHRLGFVSCAVCDTKLPSKLRGDPDCRACGGTGTSYWSDGVYGDCQECDIQWVRFGAVCKSCDRRCIEDQDDLPTIEEEWNLAVEYERVSTAKQKLLKLAGIKLTVQQRQSIQKCIAVLLEKETAIMAQSAL